MSPIQLDYDEDPFFFPHAAFEKPPRTYVDDKVSSIRSIGWNPFGSLIATGAADKTLRVCEYISRVHMAPVLS